MSSPVNMSDLPVATIANNNDVVLMRKGLTDYQCAVQLIRQINIAALDPIPGGSPVATDLFMVSRNVGGNPQNFQVRFSQVSFPKGTRMWFWNALPPTGWTIVPGTGDKILACQDFATTYAGNVTAGASAGTWQQVGVSLTVAQIPPHQHEYQLFKESAGSNEGTQGARRARESAGISGVTAPSGGGQPHNHGNSWRPLANVGVIGNKDS